MKPRDSNRDGPINEGKRIESKHLTISPVPKQPTHHHTTPPWREQQGTIQKGPSMKRAGNTAPADDWVYLIQGCAGMGGARVAMDAAKIPTTGTNFEIDAALHQVLDQQDHQSRQLGDIKSADASEVIRHIESYSIQPAAIFVTAGTPCSDVARINKNGVGITGSKSGIVDNWVSFLDDLEAQTAEAPWPVISITEMVADMAADDLAGYMNKFRTKAVLIHAADFGWVHRSRLYWVRVLNPQRHKPLAMELHDPLRWRLPPFTQQHEVNSNIYRIKYHGQQIPESMQWDDGFSIREGEHQAATIRVGGERATYDGHRFLAFTREFKHPPDAARGGSGRDQRQRFYEDQCIGPLSHYKVTTSYGKIRIGAP